ncbi:MAG: chitobiase/beta-hexosaminidase C-terminal domain-containing protein [Bacteroidales bacterium]|nr:chitobiase/beta-hexosaminidase C-terminal domain-containing protein [Bacteroidales bacterium]
MKNLFKFFAPAVIAAAAFTACQDEMPVPAQQGEVQIKVTAIPQALAGVDTRTYIDNTNTILWGTGEYMKLAVQAGENTTFHNSTDATADSFEGQPQATFAFSITPGEADSYTYMGLYPASAAVASSNTNPASYKVNLPAIQNATASSYDPAAYIMVTKPETFTEVKTVWMASYRRATALNKITLKNVPSGVSIKRVKITVPTGKYLAGARHIDLTTGDSGDIYSGGGRTESIEVKYETPLSGTNVDVWFTSWDVEVAASEKLIIDVYTTDQKCYTKEITVPSGKTIKFQEGYLNTLGANMSGITPEEVTELEDGNYLVLAKDGDKYFALKAATAGSSNDKIAAVSYEGSLSAYIGDADLIWSVTKSGGSYIIANGSNKVGWASGNTAEFKPDGDGWTTANYLIDVTWNSTNSCYYATLNSDSTRKLQKNSSDLLFAFYTSSQKDQLIFVPATVDNRTAVTLSFAEDAISKTTSNFNEFAGQVATASPNESAITDNITYAMSGDAIGTISGSTVTLNGTAGTATVTATFAGDEDYKPAEASYTIAVTSAEGPQYELVSSADEVVEGNYVITWNNSLYLPSDVTADSNPAVGTGITVASGKLTNQVTPSMVWTFTGNNSDGFAITSGSNRLNATNKAQGISIATSGTTTWKVSVDETYGMLLKGSDTGTRYLAVFNSGSWRYYSKGNDYTGTLRLYKYADSRDSAPISWSSDTGTATMASTGMTTNLPSLSNDESLSLTFASTDQDVATISSDGTVTIVGGGSATISATYTGDESSTYKTTIVSYTLTVTDTRETVATPTFNPAAGEVTANTSVIISCATEGATIYYTVDGTTPTIESTVYSSAITIDAAKTIKAIAMKANYKNSEVATAAFTVTVATVGSGTEADPYTAGDILDKYPTGSGDVSVYVTGTITGITEVSTDYGNATYTISDGSRSILVYRGKYIDNVSFTSADQIAVNDIVVIYGKIGTHNSIPQLATGNYLISVAKDTTTPTLSVDPASLSWTATETDSKTLTVTLNGSAAAGDYTYTVISGTANDWTIAKNNGTLTVAPNAENTDTENAKAIIIRIAHESDNNVYQDVTCTQAKSSGTGYTLVAYQKIIFSQSGYTNQQEISSVSGTNWSMSLGKGTNSNAPKYFTFGTAIRCYGGNTFTVTVANGYKIESIKLTFGNSDGTNAITADTGTYDDGTWSGTIENGASVTFTVGGTSGNRRLAAIEIN